MLCRMIRPNTWLIAASPPLYFALRSGLVHSGTGPLTTAGPAGAADPVGASTITAPATDPATTATSPPQTGTLIQRSITLNLLWANPSPSSTECDSPRGLSVAAGAEFRLRFRVAG